MMAGHLVCRTPKQPLFISAASHSCHTRRTCRRDHVLRQNHGTSKGRLVGDWRLQSTFPEVLESSSNGGEEDSSPYEVICGFYQLKDSERETFARFVTSVNWAVAWVVLLGGLKVCYTLFCLSNRQLPVSILDIFLLLESFSMAAVFLMGREAFQKLSNPEPNKSDIPIILEGMNRLGIAFLQIAAYCAAVTLLQCMRAAAQNPHVLPYCSGILLGFTALRGLCLTFLLRVYKPGSGKLAGLVGSMQRGGAEAKGHPLLARLSVRFAAGQMMGYTFMSSQTAANTGEYEFSELEENIIRMCIDSMRIASAAMAAEVASYVMLGVCAIMDKDYLGIVDVLTDLIDSSFLCGVTYATSNYFDRIISSHGQDMTQLVKGFGEEGMSNLFERFADLMRQLFTAGIVTIFITNGPLRVYKDKALLLLKQIADRLLTGSI